ncbi:hypothetical protein PC9H_007417 [Pleurotus ostreatus]|uniref:FAD-binding domain-containing protein n=1 Tax=Pleurotus ostreatus TaxID=5322 RepID=A0A8H6ZTJ7_PLEOS|nr:uncharacterized protein PC9H_007417 [Pleurotus ostreatus]KAF7428196.1 hypothetical protein PC9H_007417 [Pleurotus ostreatus]
MFLKSRTYLPVLLSGGGIGGLVCAIALSKYPNIDVEVYEKNSSFEEIGAGISLWPRAWKILRRMGLEKDLLEQTHNQPEEEIAIAIRLMANDETHLHTYDVKGKGRAVFSSFHRADFQRVLLKHLPAACKVTFSKRLESFAHTADSHIELRFRDGGSSACDILVGADGIRSSVRRCMLAEQAIEASRTYTGRVPCPHAESLLSGVEPQRTGIILYRAVFPAWKLRTKWPGHAVFKHTIQYQGKVAHLIAYAISRGELINIGIVDFQPDPSTPQDVVERLKVLCEGWDPEIMAIVECIEEIKPWAVCVVPPLESFVHKRAVLLGDSAHAMIPFLGSGAGQAIEDADILATLLGHAASSGCAAEEVLEVYDSIRRPFAQGVALKSEHQGHLYSEIHQPESHERFQDHFIGVGQRMTANLEWTWATTIDGMREEALQMLEESTRA